MHPSLITPLCHLLSSLACIAGGSGCERETFCGEAANSLAGFAREGIFASGEAARAKWNFRETKKEDLASGNLIQPYLKMKHT